MRQQHSRPLIRCCGGIEGMCSCASSYRYDCIKSSYLLPLLSVNSPLFPLQPSAAPVLNSKLGPDRVPFKTPSCLGGQGVMAIVSIPYVHRHHYRHLARRTWETSTQRTSARAWMMLETPLVVNLALSSFLIMYSCNHLCVDCVERVRFKRVCHVH